MKFIVINRKQCLTLLNWMINKGTSDHQEPAAVVTINIRGVLDDKGNNNMNFIYSK